MTHRRALAFVAGVLTFFSSVYVILAGLSFVLFAAVAMASSSPSGDDVGGLLATGIYGLVAASFGVMGGINMGKARNYKFCLTGAILLCTSGLLPFALGLDEEFFFPAAYLLALMVPAVGLLIGAEGDFIEPAPKPTSQGTSWKPHSWPAKSPGVVWPPAPGPTGPSPPPTPGTFRAVPPPAAVPGWPPPYQYPYPPRPFYFKDVGQARADKAGACMTLCAVFLVFFGMLGVLWPSDSPGFGIGFASLLGAILGLVAAYLVLLRVRKGLALATGMFVVASYALLTMSIIEADGILGVLLFLPFHALVAMSFVLMVRAYREEMVPFSPPMPVAAPPPPMRPQ